MVCIVLGPVVFFLWVLCDIIFGFRRVIAMVGRLDESFVLPKTAIPKFQNPRDIGKAEGVRGKVQGRRVGR